MRSPHRPQRLGFTLVELLVVIGIIAVMISMLLPALSGVRDQSRTTKCLSNLRQFGIAIQTYSLAYDGMMPIGKSNEFDTDWPTLLNAQIKKGKDGTWADDNSPIFNCPSALFQQGRNHYSAHPRLLPQYETKFNAGTGRFDYGDPYYSKKKNSQTKRVGSLKRSSELALIWDGNQSIASYAASGNESNAEYIASKIEGSRYGTYGDGLVKKAADDMNAPVAIGPNKDVNLKADSGYAQIRWRHSKNKVANFLFVDGHAAPLPAGQLFKRNILTERP